ncbi:MAG: hypothetical protein CMO80_20470 [Verrucomicrobiales bacterium]|nr:hypothetical protein [Verrucomicrobiales bacterium]
MKTKATLLAFLLAAPLWCIAASSYPEQVFQPEIVIYFGDKIGLTDEQREFIVSEVTTAKDSAREDKYRLNVEMAKLRRLLDKTITGEEEAEKQIKRLFEVENALKMANLKLLIRVKNQLSVEQRKQLRELMKDFNPKKIGPSEEVEKRLQAKIEKLKKGMREMVEIGVNPENISKVTAKFQPLINAAKYKEAEEVLDQAIKMLDDPF